jgi:predicted nucleic acid-binding protein
MPRAINDSSTLIHLCKIGHLELLREFWGELLIPPAVWREVVEEGQGRACSQELEAAAQLGWVKVVTPANAELLHLLKRELDDGEAEAIA